MSESPLNMMQQYSNKMSDRDLLAEIDAIHKRLDRNDAFVASMAKFVEEDAQWAIEMEDKINALIELLT
jgi:hypothetical protein